jgi:hypothetical protein
LSSKNSQVAFLEFFSAAYSLELQIHYLIALNMPEQGKSILVSLPKHLAGTQQ